MGGLSPKAAALGPRGGTPKSLKPEDVTHIVVHCSATGPKADVGATDITRWHINRGFADIGYHYVIRRNGDVEPGRALIFRGAHAENFNHCSVGICMVGGTDGTKLNKPQANFTDAQFRALKALLENLAFHFPNAKVVGHRDLPGVNKACPSFDVATWVLTGEVVA